MNMLQTHSRFFVCIVLLLLLGIQWLPAQKKYEREYSLKKNAVPAPAVAFIEDVFKSVKVRWYGEESLTGRTVEAKLKSGGRFYSVEFSTDGTLQDIEVLTRFSEIPGAVQKRIEKEMKAAFNSYQLEKTQVQWTGSKQLLKKAIEQERLPDGVIVRYELIVKARKTGMQKYYEVLCDAQGAISTIREIIQRNADNLMY